MYREWAQVTVYFPAWPRPDAYAQSFNMVRTAVRLFITQLYIGSVLFLRELKKHT